MKKDKSYNPNDPSIWYNNSDLREKVETIKKEFGEPFLITKDGILLYEHCTVIPSFRDKYPNEQN